MPDSLAECLKAFIAIFVLINPLEGIPFFLAGTANATEAGRLKVATKASLTVLSLLVIALLAGKAILYLFGIEIATFTIAGGVIIFLIALRMVLDPPQGAQPGEARGGDISIVPLGTPLLAGPGPISSVIVYAGKGIGAKTAFWINDLVLLAIILLASAATYIALRLAVPVGRALGPTGINVLMRVAGIIVSAIALQMILSGLQTTFPGWK